ncbi:TonB-dependent receptor plug domain-containing protein, partial [Persicitalea sp.]|uniref:TonB-dependent receptor plug domain-containing protein n=1 Tax=Persicitalea sp. TaxID=3100273 RepID=UPI0035942B91
MNSPMLKITLWLVLTVWAFASVAQDSTKTNQLQEVVVKSSVRNTLQRSPMNIAVIDAKPYYQTNLNSLDILKRSSGVNIRANGAYGANAEFFLNGIRGKQIKFFVDGNPVDNLGDTQGINIVPIQQTERFEIYKGVIPIELGTDALGGAINIVTRRETKDFVDFSTSYGSFNTTKNNLQIRKGLGRHFYLMATASLNHADNDYPILAEVPNEFGNVEIKRVRRFHDAFDFSTVRLEMGLRLTKWADAFSVQLQQARTRSDLQHNLLMRKPYGEATYTDRLRGVTVNYQKSDLWKKLDASAYLSVSQTANVFTDTTLNVYNWLGEVVDRRFSGGEISSGGNWLTTRSLVFNARQVL